MNTLSFYSLKEAIAKFSYKPGWTFTVYEDPYEGSHIQIAVSTPDAFHPEQDVVLDIHSPLPPMFDDRQLKAWMLWRLLRIETHECREWLRFKGEQIINPHVSGPRT